MLNFVLLALTFVYRGTLADPAGKAPYDSTTMRSMVFSVYAGATSATPLWQQTLEGVMIKSDGSFDVLVGDDALDEVVLTGEARYVGLRVGNADAEIRPRRAFSSVAKVSRAAVAETLATDGRMGSLLASAVTAPNVNACYLDVAGCVTGTSDAETTVEPFALREGDTTRLARGAGVTAFAKTTQTLYTGSVKTHRGDVLATAPSAGFALVHQLNGSSSRNLVVPAVVQYCRRGDAIRLPTETSGDVRVSFWALNGGRGAK